MELKPWISLKSESILSNKKNNPALPSLMVPTRDDHRRPLTVCTLSFLSSQCVWPFPLQLSPAVISTVWVHLSHLAHTQLLVDKEDRQRSAQLALLVVSRNWGGSGVLFLSWSRLSSLSPLIRTFPPRGCEFRIQCLYVTHGHPRRSASFSSGFSNQSPLPPLLQHRRLKTGQK